MLLSVEKTNTFLIAVLAGVLMLFFGFVPEVVLAVPIEVNLQTLDTDGDGLTDIDENRLYKTDLFNPDTDGDGYGDGLEVSRGYSPHAGDGVRMSQHDLDGDGMNDHLEFRTNMAAVDTDGDGFDDGHELRNGFDPRVSSPDVLKKKIIVDLSDQQLMYYWGDVKMGQITISSGRPGAPSPQGTFTINTKLPTHVYSGAGYYYPNTKWNMRFFGTPPRSYYIHGAFWHDDWGKPVSGGCINVRYEDMEGLYGWADIGTEVEIVS